jgi:uncharacterized membrane protein
MIRRHLMDNVSNPSKLFRLRGKEVTRLDGFSDAVFGFAVTLLVVSLDVPARFGDLLSAMSDLLPFAICFGLPCFLWYRHYQFFRRYGLQDGVTISLNALLFVILAYVYPLKFLFRSWLGGTGASDVSNSNPHQAAQLYIIYGLGWSAVFVVFALLYLHAWFARGALELTKHEQFETLASLWENLGMASIGLISCVLALYTPLLAIGLPGLIYFSVAIEQTVVGALVGRRRRAVAAQALT